MSPQRACIPLQPYGNLHHVCFPFLAAANESLGVKTPRRRGKKIVVVQEETTNGKATNAASVGGGENGHT